MKQKISLTLVLLLATTLIFSASLVLADSGYDETSAGDLSGDRTAPTQWTLTAGRNILNATSVAGDVEYVTVYIPHGLQLDALILESYTSTDDVAFAAVQAGPTFTEPTSGTDVTKLLGYAHVGLTQLGTDILDDLGQGMNAIGFSGPLQAGQYTFWLQQTGSATTTYSLNFAVSSSQNNRLYDEASSGDLSGDGLTPTAVTAMRGGNSLTATSVSGDREYVAITIPAGLQLDAVLLSAYTSTDNVAFAGVQRGSTFTEPPTGTNPANLLGYSHFGPGLQTIGENILDDMLATAGSALFNVALPADTYTFWLQQTGSAPTTYTLNFVTSPVLSQTLYLPAVRR